MELGEARYPTQPLPTAIYLYVNDVDAMYEQALKAGGTSMLAPTDQAYGQEIEHWDIVPNTARLHHWATSRFLTTVERTEHSCC